MDRDILQKNMLFLGIENNEPLELALVIRRNEDISCRDLAGEVSDHRCGLPPYKLHISRIRLFSAVPDFRFVMSYSLPDHFTLPSYRGRRHCPMRAPSAMTAKGSLASKLRRGAAGRYAGPSGHSLHLQLWHPYMRQIRSQDDKAARWRCSMRSMASGKADIFNLSSRTRIRRDGRGNGSHNPASAAAR